MVDWDTCNEDISQRFMCLPSGILFDRENASCLVDLLVLKSAGSKLSMFYIWIVDKACKVFKRSCAAS